MLVLASASPRRLALLKLITDDFITFAADVDENLPAGISPREAVMDLALRKAEAAARLCPDGVIIGADTVVALEKHILGKPRDAREAALMLRQLSGKTHMVYTGVCVLSRDKTEVFAEETAVTFLPLSEAEILSYAGTPEPLDKAGAYGIQGKAALFIERISGDYYNVMGLPVARLNRVLNNFGG